MRHPSTAPDGWELEFLVYPGSRGEIAVGVLRRDRDAPLADRPERKITDRMMGLRWCEGDDAVPSWQEGAHDWFVIPFTFAAAIARSLLQIKGCGFEGFDEEGFERLVEWMTEQDHNKIDSCISY